jgi:hypothetical protein
MKAAGLGDPLYTVPQVNLEHLSDIAGTLANNPGAKVAAKSGLPIPDELRGIQPDYADVGAGYDAPSERLGHVHGAAPDNTLTPGSGPASGVAPKPTRYLARVPGTSEAVPFDTGAPPAPYIPLVKSPLSPAPSATFAERFAGTSSSSPDQANQPQQAGRLPGLVTGQPRVRLSRAAVSLRLAGSTRSERRRHGRLVHAMDQAAIAVATTEAT